MEFSRVAPPGTRSLVTTTIVATQHAFDLAAELADDELRDRIQQIYELVCLLDQQMQALEQENLDLRRRIQSIATDGASEAGPGRVAASGYNGVDRRKHSTARRPVCQRSRSRSGFTRRKRPGAASHPSGPSAARLHRVQPT